MLESLFTEHLRETASKRTYYNYRCVHRDFLKRKIVKQESFNAHFTDVNHNGGNAWEV